MFVVDKPTKNEKQYFIFPNCELYARNSEQGLLVLLGVVNKLNLSVMVDYMS